MDRKLKLDCCFATPARYSHLLIKHWIFYSFRVLHWDGASFISCWGRFLNRTQQGLAAVMVQVTVLYRLLISLIPALSLRKQKGLPAGAAPAWPSYGLLLGFGAGENVICKVNLCMPHWLGATYQRTRHGDTLSDDDNWQSPQPLKRPEPLTGCVRWCECTQ